MANERDVAGACMTPPITTIPNPKFINDNHGDGNYVRSREKVEYILQKHKGSHDPGERHYVLSGYG